MQPFADRLGDAIATRGRLCVGIDPHPSMLAAWGLPDDVSGLEACARGMVEALADHVAVFKPQSALFEAYGAPGVAVLQRTLADLRQSGAVVVLDAKRGDIGSTMAGYARAYLAETAPMRADALTVSPYLGFGSLQPALEAAQQAQAGIYVLCRTSNPEGAALQGAEVAGRSVAQTMIDAANAANQAAGTGYVGLVIGGTHRSLELDLTGFTGSILVPGIGAQGGSLSQLRELFGHHFSQVLPTTSRAIMQAGPDAAQLQAAVAENLQLLNET